MNYRQTIGYLYEQLPLFSRIGAAAYKADLHNTLVLCEATGNPHHQFKSIHVAGTNGKGSTSHMLAAMLQQAGYKTGLYTSPHLKDFRERIRINGEMIPEDVVVEFVERTGGITRHIQPSFFELTVVMAFDYFAAQKVDIAVIETGLGGRLDSTNVITPLLSVITNIGYDHMNLLGNTIEKIAFEKAGIIKPGVPVVIGEYLPETKPVFIAKAGSVHAPIHFASDEYELLKISADNCFLSCTVSSIQEGITENFQLDLNGRYQAKNLLTVLCAEGLLFRQGYKVSNEAEKYALANTKMLTGLRGRWDIISTNPAIILDVAHNEDGIRQVLQQVKAAGIIFANCHFIIGMVNDKDISKILSLLPTDANYTFTNAHIPRALPHADLKEKAHAFGLVGDCFDDVNEAIKKVKEKAAARDHIIVCGSVFVVGEVDAGLFS